MNPLMRIPFIQVILRFTAKSPNQLHDLSNVGSAWRETTNCHSDLVWNRKSEIMLRDVPIQFVVCVLHAQVKKAQTIFQAILDSSVVTKFFTNSLTHRFLQPLVLHYFGIGGEYKRHSYTNEDGKLCEQFDEGHHILRLIKATTANDRFYRGLLEALKWYLTHFEYHRGSYYINGFYMTRDVESLKALKDLFILEAAHSVMLENHPRHDDVAVFLVRSGYDYRLITEYRKQDHNIKPGLESAKSLRSVMAEIAADPAKAYKQREFIPDESS